MRAQIAHQLTKLARKINPPKVTIGTVNVFDCVSDASGKLAVAQLRLKEAQARHDAALHEAARTNRA